MTANEHNDKQKDPVQGSKNVYMILCALVETAKLITSAAFTTIKSAEDKMCTCDACNENVKNPAYRVAVAQKILLRELAIQWDTDDNFLYTAFEVMESLHGEDKAHVIHGAAAARILSRRHPELVKGLLKKQDLGLIPEEFKETVKQLFGIALDLDSTITSDKPATTFDPFEDDLP